MLGYFLEIGYDSLIPNSCPYVFMIFFHIIPRYLISATGIAKLNDLINSVHGVAELRDAVCL
jgi:hypothetical protein